MLKQFLLILVLVVVSPGLHSQVVGSAVGPAHQFSVGAEYSRLNPDYWQYPTVYMNGLGIYASYNVFVGPHTGFGVEGTWRTLLDRDGGTHRLDSYVASGKYVFRFHRFMPFAKGGGGLGHFRSGDDKHPNQEPGQDGIHLVGVVGAGIDVQLTSHIILRPLEWEQQVWTFSPNLLGPHSYSFGAAYRFR